MTDHSDTLLSGPKNPGFQKKIFSTSNSDFFFINKAYLNAYLQLLDGIRQPGGLLVLIGEAGVGKTFLLRKLANEALETIRIVFCYSTSLDKANLIELINDQLAITTPEEATHSDRFAALKDYLNQCPKQGISVVLLVDDAHHLGEEVLNHLIEWSSLELAEVNGLRIVLSGPQVLNEILNRVWRKHGLATNITPVYLEPIDPGDVENYISRKVKSVHDLNVHALFPASVIEVIASYTRGIPRLINSLCEHALLITQLNGETSVSITSVKEAASELMIEEKVSTTNKISSSKAVPAEDTVHLVKATQKLIPEQNAFGEEKRKKIIESFLADLEESSETKYGRSVNETRLPNSFTDADTMVSFQAVRSVSTNHLAQSKSTAGSTGNRNFESISASEPTTIISRMIRRSDFQNGRKSPEVTRATRLMIFLIFSALLAGVLGGVASIFLFRMLPEWMPEPLPTKQETSVPTPVPEQPMTSVIAPASDPPHEEPSTTLESVVEPVATEVSAPASPSDDIGWPSEPASLASPPSTSLELSPTTPTIEVAPSVAESETPSISPPLLEQTIVETPLVSSYMSSGDALLMRGDVASARLFYEAAAAVGYAAAMTAVGKTYDPVMLSQLGIKGFRADPVKAAEWYLKAEKAGDPETAERLEGLKRWVADAPVWKETEMNTLRQLLR